jgi:tetratricopeptide (TPR) repeat protein
MSHEKLTFFQQVLELDPDSRLFFPLARLYFEHDQIEEARQTLSKGLRRHPQHFEAKLLLANIMTHQGEYEQAKKICRDLFSLFKDNRDFWENLSSMLYNSGEKDLSLAAAFFARSGSDRAITWADVLQAGLDSLGAQFDRTRPFSAEDITVTNDAHMQGPEYSETLQPNDLTHENLEHETLESPEPTGSEPQSSSISETDEQDTKESLSETRLQTEDNLESDQTIFAEALEFDLAGEPQDHPEVVDIDQEIIPEAYSDQPLPSSEVVIEVKQDLRDGEDEFEEPEEIADFDIESETRTKSMADILFKQEEYAKALDIYRELWRGSLPGKERKMLAEMIASVEEAMLHDQKQDQKEQVAEDESLEKKVDEKTEAINFLMALADRLEAKSK